MTTVAKEIVARVVAKTTDFEKGMSRVIGRSREVGAAWARAAQDINRAVTRMGAVVAGFTTVAVKRFADFEESIRRAGVVTRTIVNGQMTKDFRALEAAAKQMGATTVFTSKQAADAIGQMGLAGLETKEIIAALPTTLSLAQAAQIDIADAADIAAKTMRAFGAEAADLEGIADALVATFTRSNTDITQLGEALKFVAPVSKTLNVSLEDTTALIGKLGDVGFQGSMAGTSLVNIFKRLAGAVPASKAQLEALGIQLEDVATGKMRPVMDILRDIEKAGLSTGQVLQIFGSRGGPQLAALLEQGIDSVAEFSDGTKRLGGITRATREEMEKTIKGQFLLFWSALDARIQQIGERLSGPVIELFKRMAAALNENAEEITTLIADGLEQMIRVLPGLVDWMKETVPQFLEAARAAGQFLKPLLDFLKENPRILGALIALKTTGFLGINQALFSTGAALLKTVGLVKSLAVSVLQFAVPALTTAARASLPAFGRALEVAAMGMRTLIMWLAKSPKAVALLGGAIAYWGTQKLIEWASELKKFNDEAQRFEDIQQKISDKGNKRVDADIAKLREEKDVRERVRMAMEQQAVAQKDMLAAAAATKRAGEELAKSEGNLLFGEKFNNEKFRQSQKEADDAFQNAQRKYKELQKIIDEGNREVEQAAERRTAENARNLGRGAGQQVAQGMAQGFEEGAGGFERAMSSSVANSINDALKAARQGKIEQNLPGYSNLSDFAATGASGRQIGEFAMYTTSATPGQAATLGAQVSQAQSAGATQAQIDAILIRFLQGLQQVEAAKGRAAEAADATAMFREQLTGLRVEFTEKFPQKMAELQERLRPLAAKFLELRQQFEEGKIDSNQLEDAIRRLGNAAEETTRKLEEEVEAERRKALLQGDFQGAGLNFQQALEDRLASFRMQQFNSAVDDAFNSMMGLNRATDQLQGRFEDFNPYGGGGGYGYGPAAAINGQIGSIVGGIMDRIGGFASTGAFGRYNELQNNLLLLASQATTTKFSSIDMIRNAREAQKRIEEILRELQTLKEPPPLFVGSSGALSVTDPGLEKAQNPALANRAVQLNFPNITRLTNADATQLVQRTAQELQRQGQSL